MAQKIRVTLILLACLAAVCFAATKADIKKFPPVAGEIYGQAGAGVRSISVNGKPVSFDASQNFRSFVKLRAGEKYLILRINYEGLRIIKKYLILRKEKVKTFRVFVPKEKIEKAIRAARPTAEDILRQKRERLLAQIKKQKEKESLLKALKEKEMELKALEEKRWVKKVASPKFYPNEFLLGPSAEALAQAVDQDDYGITLKTGAAPLERLNELLQVPNFYDLTVLKGKKIALDQRLKNLINETRDFRSKPFSELSEYQKKKIMFLNRLLIEALYAQAPKRKAWLIAEAPKLPVVTKVCEYLYVWEFSEGKLLLVKEKKGSYSAEIYIPVSKEWLDLRGLSEKDLSQLINKPIKSFKPKKK
jgi:hypothetical protein